MKKQVVIIGASGHGKVVADIVTNAGDEVVGFLDDAENLPKTFAGSPILGKVEDYQRYQASEFIIAIGNALIRQKIAEKLKMSDSASERAFKRKGGILDCIYKWVRNNKDKEP